MLLIKNGYIKTMAGSDISGGSILIGDDGKIIAVAQEIAAPDGAQVIDAEGRLVTPGCVDAHCHIGLDNEGMGWEGHDYNEIVDPLTPQLRAIDSINPMDEAFGLIETVEKAAQLYMLIAHLPHTNTIKDDELDLHSIDFNKIIPMPEGLEIESGSRTTKGLKAYRDFVDVLTFAGANKDIDLLNIPEEKENIFLEQRKDIDIEDWKLGRQAYKNILQ